MLALPSFLLTALWDQFAALIPVHEVNHPLGCHRPRISNRVVFDKLIQVLVLGAAYNKIADSMCSATTIRRRRDEWIDAGIFEHLEQICLESYDRIIGLELDNLSIDGCIVKAPCGGGRCRETPSRLRQTGRQTLRAGRREGIPLGRVIAEANRHDSILLAPTLDKLARFGFYLPEQITVHLDAGYDSKKTRSLLRTCGYDWMISAKGQSLQTGDRWVVERTNYWHDQGFKKLAICTERRGRVVEAFIALANAVIILRRLIREGWATYRWDTWPTRRP